MERNTKVIHYCWFGKNPKSELIKKCIISWKNLCPDYKIIEWNEDNFNININNYVKEAYKAKKWAFVSDYARLWIIYNYGGVYLDTDVELLKKIDDLLKYDLFFACEDEKHINTGLGFGAKKNNKIIKKIMDDYENIHFDKGNGEYDLTPCPVRNTKIIKKYLDINDKFSKMIVKDSTIILSKEFFCPLDYETGKIEKTENTMAIHWYGESWLDGNEKKLKLLKRKFLKIPIIGKYLYIFYKFIYLIINDRKKLKKIILQRLKKGDYNE